MKNRRLLQIFLVIVLALLITSQTSKAYLERPTKGYFSEKIQEGQTYQWEILEFDLTPGKENKYNMSYLQGLEKGKLLELEVIKTPEGVNTESEDVQVFDYFSARIDGNEFLLGDHNAPSIWIIYYESSSLRITESVPLIFPAVYEFENGTQILPTNYTKLESDEYSIAVGITEDDRTYTIEIYGFNIKYTVEKDTGVLEYFYTAFFSDLTFEIKRVSNPKNESFLTFRFGTSIVLGLGITAFAVMRKQKHIKIFQR